MCRLVIMKKGSGVTEDTTQRVVTSVPFQCKHLPVSKVHYSLLSSCMVFVTRHPEHLNPKSHRFRMPSLTRSGSTIVSCTRVLDERKWANSGKEKRGRRNVGRVGKGGRGKVRVNVLTSKTKGTAKQRLIQWIYRHTPEITHRFGYQ